MGRLVLVAAFVALLCSSLASAAVVEKTFNVDSETLNPLCKNEVVPAVNRSLPGPTLLINEGDTLVVHVINNSPHNLTIHWHGIFQTLSAWADGPEMVTQCPILPGNRYTYRFNVTGQEGTLWWHGHSTVIRATVYGMLIIRPRRGRSYPFPRPYGEFPMILGEWWNGDAIEIERQALVTGGGIVNSDAFTINGKPGPFYNCTSTPIHKIKVIQGKTYLLRIINAAVGTQLFFKIANHRFTVVAIDASYTDPYDTDVVVLGTGQTADVLMKADQKPGNYYIAARPYYTLTLLAFNNSTTSGILSYDGAAAPTSASPPKMPLLPALNDTPTAHKFFTELTGLTTSPFWHPVPRHVDVNMFATFGFGLIACDRPSGCGGPNGQRLANSMNNVSFQLPTSISMLEAFHGKKSAGIYTDDFPLEPPVKFDYTSPNISFDPNLIMTTKSTKTVHLKFNSTVQIVLQNTAILGVENHPMHLHGFNFYVLAQGFGNYNEVTDSRKFNMVNPQERNTIAVPVGGWAVIRFRANNPGVWFFHCHVDVHMPWGLGTAFVVENGGTPSSTLPPPPRDLPKC